MSARRQDAGKVREARYDVAHLADLSPSIAREVSDNRALRSTLERLQRLIRRANHHADEWRKGPPADERSMVSTTAKDALRIAAGATRALEELRAGLPHE